MLLVCDYDGTLFRKKHWFELEENLSSLRAFRAASPENKVMIATGRDFYSFVMNRPFRLVYDYLSCYNGLVLYQEDTTVVKENTVSKEQIRKINDIVRYYDGLPYLRFVQAKRTVASASMANPCLGYELAMDIFPRMNECFLEIIDHFPTLVCDPLDDEEQPCIFLHNPSDKCDMIDYLCNIEGIAQDDVYVIGDSLNDKKMIEKYRGATLYSALSGVQAIASSTHPSVSVYVKKILKNQNNRK